MGLQRALLRASVRDSLSRGEVRAVDRNVNSLYVVVILIALLGVILSCCCGLFGGFIAGGWQARSVARRAVRIERPESPEVKPFPRGDDGLTRIPRPLLPPTPGSLPQGEAPVPGPIAPPSDFQTSGYQGGALILHVKGRSPAEKAGLRVGDIIVAVGGVEIDKDNTLSNAVLEYKPGDRVEIVFWRNGRERTAEITMGRNPDRPNLPYLGVLYAFVSTSETKAETDTD